MSLLDAGAGPPLGPLITRNLVKVDLDRRSVCSAELAKQIDQHDETLRHFDSGTAT